MKPPKKHCMFCFKWREADYFTSDNTWCDRCLVKAPALVRPRTMEEVRQRRLKVQVRQFGLTTDQFQDMYDRQDGRCAICGQLPKGKRSINIDHDHDTGAVRELLCTPCNVGLGFLNDDPDVLAAALAYLIKHGKQPPVVSATESA